MIFFQRLAPRGASGLKFLVAQARIQPAPVWLREELVD